MMNMPVNKRSATPHVFPLLVLSLAVLMVAGLAVGSCGRSGPATESTPAGAAPLSSAPAAPAPAATAATAEPQTVADIFPPGPGRDLVLNNCASCHNVACSAIGQRSKDRWESLKSGHRERVAGADLDAL